VQEAHGTYRAADRAIYANDLVAQLIGSFRSVANGAAKVSSLGLEAAPESRIVARGRPLGDNILHDLGPCFPMA
jgi:hypothetical protein